MELINKYKAQIIFGTAMLIAVGVLIFYIFPTVQGIQEKIVHIDAETKKNVILSRKLDFLDQLEPSEMEEKYRLTNQALLKDKNPYKIFGVIDNVLSKINANEITLGGIQFMPGDMKSERKKQANSSLMFDVSIEGKYDVIREFVKLVEVNYPLVTVTAVSGEIADTSDLKIGLMMHIVPESEYIASMETPLVDFNREDLDILEKISSLEQQAPETPFTPQKFNNTNIF